MKLMLQLLLIMCVIGCTTTKNTVEENPNFTKTLKIDKNDLQILTPKTELTEKKNNQFLPRPQKREELRKIMLSTIQSKFPNLSYVAVPFLYKDSYAVNSVLESELNFKTKKAPSEIVTQGKRYSILLCTNGYYGDIERGVLYLVLIDNKRKTRKTLKHVEYKHSPLETEKFKRKILKILEEL